MGYPLFTHFVGHKHEFGQRRVFEQVHPLLYTQKFKGHRLGQQDIQIHLTVFGPQFKHYGPFFPHPPAGHRSLADSRAEKNNDKTNAENNTCMKDFSVDLTYERDPHS
jgi:hypothetical protein